MKTENWIKLNIPIKCEETDKYLLKGKVIDSHVLNCGYDEANHLIIKFTDGTFICVGVVADDMVCECNLDDKYCLELMDYKILPHYIDDEGNIHLEKYLQERIDMGIIEPLSDDEKMNIIKKYYDEKRNRRYQQYLKLKEEFGDMEK